jgi:hypothetical protein
MTEARMPKGTTEQRVQRFSELLDHAFERIENQEPIKGIGKVSPVEVALAPKRDAILASLDRGYAPGTIARIIKESDELDSTFAQETIRLAILRIAGRSTKRGTKGTHKPHKGGLAREQSIERKSAPARNQGIVQRPPIAPTFSPSHAGFEEDPR